VQPTPFWSTTAFDNACRALVQRDAKGQLTQTGAILQQGIPFEIWLWQQGADVLSADGKTPAFDNQAGLKALNWLVANFQLNGGANEIGRLVSGTTLTEGINGVFTHGKLGMLPVTYGSYVRLKAQASDLPSRLATLPTIDGGKPVTMSDAIYGFSPQGAANPHPEATWDFLKWLATDVDTQVSFIKGGAIPALLQAQQAPAAASDADVQVMLQALKVARNPQDISWEPEVASILNGEVGKAVSGQETPQQALDAADSAAKRTIQQDETLAK
jgi:ABC-type glycerol-3-phosphate transport system substrate-binding protein